MKSISMNTFKMICDLPSLRQLTILSTIWAWDSNSTLPCSSDIIKILKQYASENNYDINLYSENFVRELPL